MFGEGDTTLVYAKMMLELPVLGWAGERAKEKA
jgi:hypothetical protein